MALLPFQDEILQQILTAEKGLWIVESGMGLQKILAHYVVQLEKKNTSKLLYLFLNTDSQVPIFDRLVQMAPHRYKLVNADYTPEQRSQLWQAGGVCFVTSRILIVDMLNGLIPWKRLGGIIYYMTPGHMIKENCTENFILRVYAQHVYNSNRPGSSENGTSSTNSDTTSSAASLGLTAFDGYNDVSNAVVPANLALKLRIKAFTESPFAFANGWNKLEKVAKALKIGTKIFMWPRFRKSVNETLKAHQPDTVQLHIDLAPLQSQIHANLLAIFKMCVEDLRRKCAGQQVGTMAIPTFSNPIQESDVSYDKALFSNFYSGIQSILDPLGEKVPRKIRHLIADLNLLRELIRMLIRADAVKFYEKYHQLLREQTMSESGASLDWLHFKEADEVASLAQQRLWRNPVYKPPFQDNSAASRQAEAVSLIETFDPPPLVLEDNPKWRALGSVLQEIELENSNIELGFGSQPIVILVRDEETRFALSEYLTMADSTHYLLHKLKRHVLTKVENFRANKMSRKANKTPQFFADSAQPSKSKNRSPNMISPTMNGSGLTSDTAIDVEAERETNSGASSLLPELLSLSGADLEKQLMYTSLLAQMDERIVGAQGRGMAGDLASALFDDGHNDFEKYFGLVQPAKDNVNGLSMTPVVIQTWERNFGNLPAFFDDVSPHFIILYDPDPGIVRQVECYKAARPGWFVRQYVLIYKDSLEHDKYVALLKQEQDVFQQLVAQKGKMAEEDEETQADIVAKTALGSTQGSSRKGGGTSVPSPSLILGGGILSTTLESPATTPSSSKAQEETVIVDIREFRSKLPGMLHQHGIRILPQTLIIADYILSPDIAVERKSLPDLRQSFRSGHLYNQIENLTRIYSKPILLIEFDSSEPFELVSSEYLQSGRLSIHDLNSQLALLTKAFPKMRVCWSRSPSQTAQLFLALKQGKPQPNSTYVSQFHAGLSPELSSHGDATEELEIIEDSGEGPRSRKRGRKTNQQEETPSNKRSNSGGSSLEPNLAPFASIDVLKRIPGLHRENNWRPILYPSSPVTSPTQTASTSPTSKVSPTRSSPLWRGLTPAKSPEKEAEQSPAITDINDSLFEIEEDENVEQPAQSVFGQDTAEQPDDPLSLAPRALPPHIGASPDSSAATPTTSPVRSHSSFQGCSSLAALAALPQSTFTTLIGARSAAELWSFLHKPADVAHLVNPQEGGNGGGRVIAKKSYGGGGGGGGGGGASGGRRGGGGNRTTKSPFMKRSVGSK